MIDQLLKNKLVFTFSVLIMYFITYTRVNYKMLLRLFIPKHDSFLPVLF